MRATRRGATVGWSLRWGAVLLGVLLPALAARADERIYLAVDDHTDYFWAGNDATYRQAFQDMLDYYMNQNEATAGGPPDQQGRFNTDGSFWISEYEASRSAKDFTRLVNHLVAGDISTQYHSLVPLPGAMPLEALLRDMYYAGRLQRRYGVDVSMAVAMENQTLPGGIASLWAGAGARYSWKGICNCATSIDAANRKREIYNFVGPDGRSVVMKWNSQTAGNAAIGGYAESRDPAGVVNYILNDKGYAGRWPFTVAAAFGQGWDDLKTLNDNVVNEAINGVAVGRRIIVSNEADFFADFVATYANKIPNFSGSFGNDWEIGVASLPGQAADVRGAVEKLRTAEALATVTGLVDAKALAGLSTADRDAAYTRMALFYEHCFTNGGPAVSGKQRVSYESDAAMQIHTWVDALHDTALTALGNQVALPLGVGERHVVFNPLSYQRTDVAVLASSPAGAYHVVDVTGGTEVPSQTVTLPAGGTGVAIIATGVPPIGYRVYEVKAGAGKVFPDAATIKGGVLTSDRYQITLAQDGSITSLIDVNNGNRELVDAKGSLNGGGLAGGKVTSVEAGPVRAAMEVQDGSSPKRTVRVTTFAGLDRIEVSETISGGFSGTLAYEWDFGLTSFSIRHEETGMIARVDRLAKGGDYADENVRLDWLTLNHFVDVSEAGYGVTLSSRDAQFFKVGASTLSNFDLSKSHLFTLAGTTDLVPGLFPSQGGVTTFENRFALAPHGAYDSPSAMRFALAHANPFVATKATGVAKGPLPADTYQLLSLTGSDAIVWALKPADDGIDHGVVARVWNLADGPSSLDLTAPPYSIAGAVHATHVETDGVAATLKGGHLMDSLNTQQLETYRLTLGPPPPPPDGGVADAGAVDAAPRDAAAAIDLSVPPDLSVPDLAMADLSVPALDLAGHDLARPDLAGMDLAGMDLAGHDLSVPDLGVAVRDAAAPGDAAMAAGNADAGLPRNTNSLVGGCQVGGTPAPGPSPAPLLALATLLALRLRRHHAPKRAPIAAD